MTGLTATDLFCGAGGSSLGAEFAGVKLMLGLNHWRQAILTHSENFQDAEHDCADVSALTTSQIRRYPDTDILMASPECTNHSIAKGGHRKKPQVASLWEDGPAGDDEQDRSRATMWDVIRFCEQKIIKGKPYKAVIVENVVDAFKWGANDNGQLFDAWLQGMAALGYKHEIVWLNSMFAPPTPQSRDRMYVVFWRKGAKKPNLKIEPPAWCLTCEKIVAGQQTWKKPGERPWGRYGPQYLYGCPECHNTVVPGAFPATTAIDFDHPIEKIGDRKKPLATNTLNRIRRGLERLGTEPFAVRLLHGINPRPLTLPIVSVTRRHDLAVVLPTAAGTFERTPGNRARRADLRPCDTVHGSFHQAVVLPPMGGVEARDPATQPAPTQTTTTRASLVVPMATADGTARDAEHFPSPTLHAQGGTCAIVELQQNGDLRSDKEPAHTMRAGGFHHGVLLMRNNSDHGDTGCMTTPAETEPARALTTGCHQSLIVPYDSSGRGRSGDREPASTLSTHDRLGLVVPREPIAPAIKASWSQADLDACGFRMFQIDEISRTMQMELHTNGDGYIVTGNKREQMAQYGNAVTPPVMRLLVQRVAEALCR